MNSVVVNSYYEHEEHGKVKVVSVDETVVSFEIVNKKSYVPGMGGVLQGKHEGVSDFIEQTEPADITVAADSAVLFGDMKEPTR